MKEREVVYERVNRNYTVQIMVVYRTPVVNRNEKHGEP